MVRRRIFFSNPPDPDRGRSCNRRPFFLTRTRQALRLRAQVARSLGIPHPILVRLAAGHAPDLASHRRLDRGPMASPFPHQRRSPHSDAAAHPPRPTLRRQTRRATHLRNIIHRDPNTNLRFRPARDRIWTLGTSPASAPSNSIPNRQHRPVLFPMPRITRSARNIDGRATPAMVRSGLVLSSVDAVGRPGLRIPALLVFPGPPRRRRPPALARLVPARMVLGPSRAHRRHTRPENRSSFKPLRSRIRASRPHCRKFLLDLVSTIQP